MSLICVLLLGLIGGLEVPAFSFEPSDVAVQWQWLVVSTPDIVGPFRGNEPGFRPLVPKQPLPLTVHLDRDKNPSGTFEALVSEEGVTVPEKTLNESGPETGRLVNEIL